MLKTSYIISFFSTFPQNPIVLKYFSNENSDKIVFATWVSSNSIFSSALVLNFHQSLFSLSKSCTEFPDVCVSIYYILSASDFCYLEIQSKIYYNQTGIYQNYVEQWSSYLSSLISSTFVGSLLFLLMIYSFDTIKTFKTGIYQSRP